MDEDIMRLAGFGAEVELVKAGKCPFCKQKVNPKKFRDALSRKEFRISGLCQSCQDGFFKVP